MNLGFAVARSAARRSAGALIAAFGLSAALLVDAASFLVIAVLLATTRQAARDSSTPTRSRGASASATGSRSRADTALVRTLLVGAGARARSASRWSSRSR